MKRYSKQKKIYTGATHSKKNSCKKSNSKSIKERFVDHITISDALYQKYSGSQNHFYLNAMNSIIQKQTKNNLSVQYEDMKAFIKEEQILRKCYNKRELKNKHRSVLKLFEIHKQIPRLFIIEVSDIINKSHHKKRLIEYYRLAKNLNFTINEDSFSSFLYSLHNHKKYFENHSFEKMIGEISCYQFTRESQYQQNPQKILINQLQELLQHFKFQQSFINPPVRSNALYS